MAKRIEYQIVGRYMSGKEVTGYHLQSIETGKSGKYTRDQVAFLVGRDQITNCTAQLYQDKVLLRGKGMSLEDLPVQYEDGDTRNTEKLGRIKKGTSTSQAMEQFLIVGTIKSGRNTVGYVLQNAGCGIKKFKRQQVIELAQQGKIGNARVQMYQGKPLLRGIDCNLDELPSENIGTTQTPQVNQQPVMKETKTLRLIILNQFSYCPNAGSLSKRVKVNLVDFAVHNQSMNKSELRNELMKFKQEVTKIVGHAFYNTDDVIEMDVAGRKCLGTFDDPYYTDIFDYFEAACKLNAKLIVDGNADFMSEDADELDNTNLDSLWMTMLDRANEDLEQIVRCAKSSDNNKTLMWIPNKNKNKSNIDNNKYTTLDIAKKLVQIINNNTGSKFELYEGDDRVYQFFDRTYAKNCDVIITLKIASETGRTVILQRDFNEQYNESEVIGNITSMQEAREYTLRIVYKYKEYVNNIKKIIEERKKFYNN